MGLQDRHYYREESRGKFGSVSGLSVNTWIIIVNVAIFAMELLVPKVGDTLSSLGCFSTEKVIWSGGHGLQFWRFVTFQFLHASLTHVGFNMFGLYIFGGMVEEYLGPKKYLAFYLTCGIFGGLMYLLLNGAGIIWVDQLHFAPIPGLLFTRIDTALVGASAGVLGIIMACAYIAPNMQVQLLFPPILIKIRTMAYAYVALAIASLLFNGKNAGGEAAHLGGAAAGAFFIRNSHLLRDFFDVFSDSRKAPRPTRGGEFISDDDLDRPHASRPDQDAEVDRILEKTKSQGLQSLTDAERATLRRDNESRRARG